MQRILFCTALLCTFLLPARAQSDSCGLRISLLTCAPGAELYSIFGHTALRVKNEAMGSDMVYNYGTFAFGPDFYVQFVRGKLPYFLSLEEFSSFLYTYEVESRSVWEQELRLSCTEKAALLSALNTNALPENRTYRYDFLYDNCTTRARDMVTRQAAPPVKLATVIPADAPSFRHLIHQKLDSGHLYWSKLGIDLLLGAKLDKRVTNEQAMFLPDNLLRGFAGATAAGIPLVTPTQAVLQRPSPLPGKSFFTPFVSFVLVLLFLLPLSFVRLRAVRRAIAVFDFLLFFLTGIVGVVLIFMWTGTDHALCANNWNLLWALPTHLLAAPFLRSSQRWVNYYLLATIVLLSALLIGWIFLPQELNTGFLPLVLLLLLRSWLIILKPHHGNPHLPVQAG